MVGKTIAHYHIIEKIGEGGMGVVFKARDAHLDRLVALKILPPEKVADPDRKERFVREAKSASALNHPNIITVYDIAEADGVQFIAMEYVHGKTLEVLIGRKGLRLPEALTYAADIASALASAHEAGIVHRDLKPSNIMVREDGLVKVLDFGLAKLSACREPDGLAPTEPPRLKGNAATQAGLIVGTAAYMSPEQAEGKELDARSDIFSFGSVLYEMLSGQRAFQGQTPVSILSAILHTEPKPINEISEEVPHDVAKLIERCLRKEPQRRFQHMADIHVVLDELKEESSSNALRHSELEGSSYRQRARRFKWAAVLLGALAIIGAMVQFRWIETDTPVPPTKVVPFTSFAGRELEPAISPDGKQVAFVWNGDKGDNLDVYVKLIDSGIPHRLTHNPGEDRVPAWSPNGDYIAFCRRSEQGAEIFSVPALGGPERKLGESELSWPAGGYYLGANPFGLAWSPDRKWLAIVSKSLDEPNHIALLSTETGAKHDVTNPTTGHFGDWLAAFSPKGDSLAFVRVRGYQNSDLYVVALSTRGVPAAEPKRLTFDERDILGLDWTPDGQSLVFSSNRGGSQSLWKVATSGGPPEQLLAAGENAYSVSISRLKSRLVYTRQMIDTNIWRTAGPGAAPLRKGLATKLIASTREEWAPQFSRDGKRIAFKSTRSGNEEVWVCDSDGSHAVQLTSFGGPGTGMPRWSYDGDKIAFYSRKEGHADIYVIGAAGGLPRRVTPENSDESFPSWSRDGRWIYFGSNRGGTWQVWKIPVEGGPATQITQNGGMEAFESADGKFLYYTKRNRTGVWRISAERGEEAQVLDRGVWGAWALVGNGIYVLDSKAEAGPAIEFFDLATRGISQIVSLPKDAVVPTGGHVVLAVSPDASSVLYVQLDRIESDLILVDNFQ